MVSVEQITSRLKTYVVNQLNTMAIENPMIGFIKPLITRAIDKNFSKVDSVLKLIADQDGNVDIENILSEMIQSVMSSNPFTINTSFIGDVEIGGGLIKLNLPLTNKKLVFNHSDLEGFREVLTAK